MKFRDFTKHDWYGYSGCENENPLISTEDFFIFLEGHQYGAVWIIDGKTIAIHLIHETSETTDYESCQYCKVNKNPLDDELFLSRTCDTELQAVTLANELDPLWGQEAKLHWLFINKFHFYFA